MKLQGFPLPDNAPPAGACLRVEQPELGLMVWVLDPPHRSLAVLDAPLLRDLEAALSALEREVAAGHGPRGLIITGRAPGQFAAGADIDAIAGITDPKLVEEVVLAVHAQFRRLQELKGLTKIAAVSGAVPGGACELALCCDAVVASDDPKTRIGLPEVLLGILPGWGGCHRLPRKIGVPAALGAILTGKLYSAKEAWKLGIVDRLTKPEYLLKVAAGLALGREPLRRRRRPFAERLMNTRLLLPVVASKARKQALAQTKGNYPAPPAIIDLVVQAPSTPMEQAAGKEATAIARLATGPVCKNLIAIFKASEDAKKIGKSVAGFTPRSFSRAGVLGAGVMGGGIASAFAAKGIAARLMDLVPAALDQALFEHRKEIEKLAQRRKLERAEADAAIDRLEVCGEIAGFQRAQIVVEAVAEKLAVKQAVFRKLAEQVAADAILATNTSSLSVTAIAQGVPHPERVCGMHFFNPVKKMPLVEVVRGATTSPQTVAEVAALAVRLGKTPVVTKDCAGFLVNRVLGPYIDEALRMFLDGADPQRVDRLMVQFGMPMGPFLLLDEVGFDIAAHAAQSLHEAYGERMTPSTGVAALLSPERLGKKTGLGFYRHPAAKGGKKGKPVLAADLSRHQTGEAARHLGDQAIVDRLVLSMVNEAARCLEEQVVATPAELDLATVFGSGFAPFRGGLLRYADAVGAKELVLKLEAIAAAPDVAGRPGGAAKFTPATLLQRLAAEGRGFHGDPPSSAPSGPRPREMVASGS